MSYRNRQYSTRLELVTGTQHRASSLPPTTFFKEQLQASLAPTPDSIDEAMREMFRVPRIEEVSCLAPRTNEEFREDLVTVPRILRAKSLLRVLMEFAGWCLLAYVVIVALLLMSGGAL